MATGNGKTRASERLLGNYDEDFLECRDMRHAWSATEAWWYEGGETRRELECTRCGTLRVDRWSSLGKRIGTGGYKWPEGYVVKDGSGSRLTNEQVRVEVLARVKVFKNEEAMRKALFAE